MSNSLPRILIVEDDRTFRETVRDILRDEGYKVKGARSLDKAVKRLNKHNFDLVLSDLNIGDRSGLEVVQIAHQTHPNAKIMLMSATADPELLNQALEADARFLPKPFKLAELMKAVEELLKNDEQDSGTA